MNKFMKALPIILLLALLLLAGQAKAEPYEFSKDLDSYTWGESLSRVKEVLGDPYSQDPGGVVYLLSGTWMKQVLIYNDQVYQFIERQIYSLEDQEANKEYEVIKRHLREFYGPPSQEDVACPNPAPQVKCRITRWQQHPTTQVFVAHSQDRVVSVMLGISSVELRRQALSDTSHHQVLSVGQIIGAYQQDPQQAAHKYHGQKIKIMGQSGGLAKDAAGRIYFRLYNAFNSSQRIICFFPIVVQRNMAQKREPGHLSENLASHDGGMGPPPEGTVIVEGIVGEYKNQTLQLHETSLSLPSN